MRFFVRDIDCRDCRLPFEFDIAEQSLGNELGFDHPTRCRACRRSLEKTRRAFRQYGKEPRLSAALPR